MSFVHDLPYLGAVNHGAALRTKATKLQSYAELDEARGGNFGEKLKAFWQDQKARLEQDYGHPADGLHLQVPGLDPRVECYRVLSAIRLNPADDNKAAWIGFCDYFINRWTSSIPVASVAFTEDSPTTVEIGKSITVSAVVSPENASDKRVVFMTGNADVATVDNGDTEGSAVVNGVAEGTVTVTVIAQDGSGAQATLEVTVTPVK